MVEEKLSHNDIMFLSFKNLSVLYYLIQKPLWMQGLPMLHYLRDIIWASENFSETWFVMGKISLDIHVYLQMMKIFPFEITFTEY